SYLQVVSELTIDAETILAEILAPATIVSASTICHDGRMTDSSTLHAVPTQEHGPLGSCSPHHEAWRSLAQTHAAVSGRLQEALAAAELPPLAWFEVLAAIAAPQ